MYRSHRRDATRGYTLAELLVTLGVVAVLTAILLPTLARVRANAIRTVCASNLRQIGHLVYAYANHNGGEIPACYAPVERPARPGTRWVPTPSFASFVEPGGGGLALLIDPPSGQARQTYVDSARVFFCPADGAMTPDPSAPGGLPFHPTLPPLRATSYNYLYVPRGGHVYHPAFQPGRLARHARHNVGSPTASSAAVARDRVRDSDDHHLRGSNVLYLDGHIGWVPNAGVAAAMRDAGPGNAIKALLDALDG